MEPQAKIERFLKLLKKQLANEKDADINKESIRNHSFGF